MPTLNDNQAIIKNNPFPFVSAGRSLNDKDRDINSDLEEIHAFFQPIDNIFGDYEIRKKLGLEKELFIKRRNKKIIDGEKFYNEVIKKIEPTEWQELYFKYDPKKYETHARKVEEYEKYSFMNLDMETVILQPSEIDDLIKNENPQVLVVSIIFSETTKKITLDAQVIPLKYYEKLITGKVDDLSQKDVTAIDYTLTLNDDEINLQTFIIDPIKIRSLKKMSKSRFDGYLEQLMNDCNNANQSFFKGLNADKINIKLKETVRNILSTFYKLREKKHIIRITDTSVYEMYLDKILELNKEKKENIVDVINTDLELYLADSFCRRKFKLKNLEMFNFLRARVGYENGHFVLFLHPYESESNNPIRIPSE